MKLCLDFRLHQEDSQKSKWASGSTYENLEKLLNLTLIVGMFNDSSTLETMLCHLVVFGISSELKNPPKS